MKKGNIEYASIYGKVPDWLTRRIEIEEQKAGRKFTDAELEIYYKKYTDELNKLKSKYERFM